MRQSAAKVYAHYVRVGAAGSVTRLFELTDKESDSDVLNAAFESLREAAMNDERENYASKLVKLTHGKSEEVRTLALRSLIRLLDIGREFPASCQLFENLSGPKRNQFKIFSLKKSEI